MTNTPEATPSPPRPDLRICAVMFHGLTGMPSEMRPVAKHLQQLGVEVECPLLPGHGGNHTELLAVGCKEWVAAAKQAVDEATQKYDLVFVGGLSMGALLAALSSINNPKVGGIILLSPTLIYDGQNASGWQRLLFLVDIFPPFGRWFYWTEQPPYGLRDERLQKIITKQVEAAKRGDTTDFGLFRTYAKSLRQLYFMVKETRRRASQIQAPALVIHSLEDTLTTRANATEICSRLGSKEITLMLLGGCDHVLTLDLRKRDVIKAIGDFISEQSRKFDPSKNQDQSGPSSTSNVIHQLV